MTLRTNQTQLKRQGHPWTTSKVFVDAAILGPWIPYDSFENYMDVEFQFSIDGSQRQCAKGREMMMPPEALLVYISKYFPLKANDIIFTGTPAGVTSVSRNSSAELRWDKYSYRVKWGQYLRAQTGCRKTLMARTELKHSRRSTTFIKQQNNAITQQVAEWKRELKELISYVQ